MTEDRSLDDFLGGESDGDDESDGGAGSDGAETAETVDATGDSSSDSDSDSHDRADGTDAAGESAPPTTDSAAPSDSVDPAVGTYRWDPEGVACAACGETVNRLWLDDGEQVCEACKEW
ncbi:hypothetical protein C474_03950 [Halogeometricum pallidum JCM 14848]|uniref:DUF7573 domain-containing protein n=1 Tax=Halogeometricum pallidum JCM 14848 TaxID=1227487 RepID=M0DF16_HALPD|nr:hypothetical protein [Halogeometricum pallidum]ELZ34081.1 hypothetical protein C474_03950 [Halogeometricum pallidum JCM 14848]